MPDPEPFFKILRHIQTDLAELKEGQRTTPPPSTAMGRAFTGRWPAGMQSTPSRRVSSPWSGGTLGQPRNPVIRRMGYHSCRGD